MSQGYELEDISPSDNVLLLCVLGQVLPNHQGCDTVTDANIVMVQTLCP